MSLFQHRTISGRCPACGAAHAACGPPSDTVPVDERMEAATVGGPISRYNYRAPGGRSTVLKLNEVDAARLGLTEADLVGAEPAPDPEVQAKARPTGQNKARTAAANKARTPRGKGDAAPTGGGDGGPGGGD